MHFRKEGNGSFNDTLNTFYLLLAPWATFPIISKESFICTIPVRITHTHTSGGALAGMSNSSMGPPWQIYLTTHCIMSCRSTMELHLGSLGISKIHKWIHSLTSGYMISICIKSIGGWLWSDCKILVHTQQLSYTHTINFNFIFSNRHLFLKGLGAHTPVSSCNFILRGTK